MKNTWIKKPGGSRDVNKFGLFQGQKQSQCGWWLVLEGQDIGHGVREVVIGQITRFIPAA